MKETDREWYKKVPIKEINELIEPLGWNVKRIFAALQIQELELKVKEAEALHELLKYHWEAPEYPAMKAEHDRIEKFIENLGEEQPDVKMSIRKTGF